MSGQTGNVDNATGLRVWTAEELQARPLTPAPFEAHDSSQYLYLELARWLEAELQRGVFPVGTKVPSIRETSKQAQVAESTVTNAYQELVKKGFLQVRDRSGYIVVKLPVYDPVGTESDPGTHSPGNPHATQPAPVSTSGHQVIPARPVQALPAQGPLNPAQTRVASLMVQTVLPPPEIANAMNLPDPNQPVILRRRVITTDDGIPVEVRTSFLPASIAAGTPLAGHDIIPGRWETLIYDHTGRTPGSCRTTTTARAAHAWEADALKIPIGAIVLARDIMLYATRDLTGPALDLTRSTYPADSTRAIHTYPIMI